MAESSRIENLNKRYLALKQLRDIMLPEWRGLADAYCPRTLPYLTDFAASSTTSTSTRGRRNRKIINTTPVTAARTHQRGMTAGVASPARPWFRMRSPDRDLNRFQPVALWLHEVQQVLEDMFSRANFYNVLGTCYGEEGKFGTLAMSMMEDFEDDLRCTAFPIGSYCIAESSRGRVDTIYRSYRPTAVQIIEQFGMQDESGAPLRKPDWSRISHEVKLAYESKTQRDSRFEVIHALQPNYGRDESYVDSKNMPFSSCYYEPNQVDKNGKLLRESGFHENPIKVARWDVLSDDPWGTGPGLEAQGDAQALQERERQLAKRIDKHNDPALVGSPELKNKRVSLLGGDITYVGFTPNGGKPQLSPIHDVDPDTTPLDANILTIEKRIQRVWDEDLFLMLSMSDAKDVTAEAIARKFEEKVVILGPVLERQNDELFDPAIDRAFSIALRRGLLPPAPEELQGSPLKIEYVSMLAQAQRLVGASSIDRMVGFIAGLADAQSKTGEAPEVFDKLDFDQAVDEYHEALGTMPTIIRSDDQVAELRAQRAQRQQAQAMAAAAKPAADAAKAVKDLSEAKVNGESVLNRMTQPA